jgi:hypothetical protein
MEWAANFLLELNTIYDIDTLNLAKGQIKTEIMQPNLNWEHRATLYHKVRLINERIRFLTNEAREETINMNQM